jgi:hypothetical protein
VNLAAKPWIWLLVAATLVGAAASSGAYRRSTARMRRWAVRRGLVSVPAGRELAPPPEGALSDLSWLAFPAAAWVIAAPWIWGYDSSNDAVLTDVVTGAAVLALAVGAILFPALGGLEALAGLWLVVAPWVVGYGNANGPIGIADSVSGVVIAVAAVSGMSAAARSLRPGTGGAVGRLHSRPPER